MRFIRRCETVEKHRILNQINQIPSRIEYRTFGRLVQQLPDGLRAAAREMAAPPVGSQRQVRSSGTIGHVGRDGGGNGDRRDGGSGRRHGRGKLG
jgi:hypothetical protein